MAEDTEEDKVDDPSNPTNVIEELTQELVQLKEENENLKARASTDPLTRTINKGECERRLKEELERAKRTGRPVSIAFLDIDDYGVFNKKYGQLEGDEVLRRFSAYVQSKLRAYDVLGRFGGEEFILILPETNGFVAHGVIERLRKEFEEEFRLNLQGNIEKITVSIGVASSEDLDENKGMEERCDKLIKMANDAEKAAKADGKARTYLNVGGAILDANEAAAFSANDDVLKIISRYRKDEITIIDKANASADVGLGPFLKTITIVENGFGRPKLSLGNFDIRTVGGDASTTWSAYFYAPKEGTNAVRDTMEQLLGQLRRNCLPKFPNADAPEKGLWLNLGLINALTFLTTHTCSMRCVYCKQDHAKEEILPPEVLKRCIDEVTQEGKRTGILLNVTGGEPFTRKELLFEILDHAKLRGMYSIMNTNALHLTVENARKLLGTGIKSISISLDSALPEIEEMITRTERAFGRVMEGLKNLARARDENQNELTRVALGYVITNANFKGFVDFVEIMCSIRRDLALRLFDDINPLPVKDAKDLYLTAEQIHEFNDHIVPRVKYLAHKYGLPLLETKVGEIFAAGIPREKKEEYEQRVWFASKGIYYGFREIAFLPCLTAMTSASILPDGRVFPCTYHREADENTEGRIILGNVKDTSLEEMRRKHFELLRGLPNRNRVCERLCGPDLKRVNREVISGLRKAGVM